MRPRRLARFALAAATVTAAIGLSAAPAHADNAYHPSDADFDDCPAPPAGAAPGGWTCYSMTALTGSIQANLMKATIDSPWRLTVAQGSVGGVTVARLGALRADPVALTDRLPGLPATGWKAQLYATGKVEPGLAIPHHLGVRARVLGDDLTGPCTVGSVQEPIAVNAGIRWALPAFIDGVFVLKLEAESLFAMPNALNCGDLASTLRVNARLGLPAPATADRLIVQWAIRSKKY